MQTHWSLGRFSMLFFLGGTWQIIRNRTPAEWWLRIPIAGLISRCLCSIWGCEQVDLMKLSMFLDESRKDELERFGSKIPHCWFSTGKCSPRMIKHFWGWWNIAFRNMSKTKHISLSAMYFQMPLGKRLAGSVMKASHMLVYLSVEPPSISLHFWVVRVVNRIQGHFGQLVAFFRRNGLRKCFQLAVFFCTLGS